MSVSYGAPYGYGSGYGYGVTGRYDPFADASLVLWLDADYGLFQERTGASATTPASADGDPVGTWRDRRGVIQATIDFDSRRPVNRPAGVNGRRSVEFDGADDRLVLGGTGGNGILRNRSYVAMIAGIKAPLVSSAMAVFAASQNASTSIRFLASVNAGGTAGRVALNARVVDSGSDVGIIADSAFSDGESFVLTGIADYAGADLYLRKNGSQIAVGANILAAGTTPDTDSLRTMIGALTNGTALFDGWIAELMVFVPPAGLTAAELLIRERYIGARMGVAF